MVVRNLPAHERSECGGDSEIAVRKRFPSWAEPPARERSECGGVSELVPSKSTTVGYRADVGTEEIGVPSMTFSETPPPRPHAKRERRGAG
jgi:hypothetical protein